MPDPVARLRALHAHSQAGENPHFARPHCQGCYMDWPCDTIAALDALEAELTEIGEARYTDALQARIDALEEERKAVCDEYGLPDSYPILRQHIEANRSLVSALDKQTIQVLQSRNDAATMLIRQALDHHRTIHWVNIEHCIPCAPLRAWPDNKEES